jgi:fermentation-respiration switch protein FrsA (DUF1100 family)
MVVQCRHDAVVPFAGGGQVVAAARDPKVFLPIDTSCHEEASLMSPARYSAALSRFLLSLRH